MPEETPPEIQRVNEPSGPNLERLLKIPVVQESVKDIAEWAADPENKMARLVEAVVDTADPEKVLKEMDPGKDHQRALTEMTRTYEEKIVKVQKKLLASLDELGEDRDLVYGWANALSHELSTSIVTASGGLQELARGGTPAIIDMALHQAVSGSLRTHLVLRNFQELHQSGIFREGLAETIEAIKTEAISDLVFDKATGEVLAYFKKILGDNLSDETRISVVEEQGVKITKLSEEEEKNKKSFKHMLFNLMVNSFIHGERNRQVAVRKTEDGVLEIESEIKRVHPNMGISQEEFAEQVKSLLTQQGKVFNGRDLTVVMTQPWQGLGLGVTVARILAAKLGLSIEHRVEGNKVIARVG